MDQLLNKDPLGDRIKGYEKYTTGRRAQKGKPFVARLDGKAFHNFCKGLPRPYDSRLFTMMDTVMLDLVDYFQPIVGYTQSDEINLAWYIPEDSNSEYPYGGRFQKLESLLAARATAIFNKELKYTIPERSEAIALFDCRVFEVPSLMEAYNAILWRQQDAKKNAVQMAAQNVFSHKKLQHKHTGELEEMLKKEGINFELYPARFKRGVFARRVKEVRELSLEQLEKIPVQYRPTTPVERTFVDLVDIQLGPSSGGACKLFPHYQKELT